MRRSSRLVLGLAALAVLATTPVAFAQQNVQSLVQRYYQQQQQEQQQLQQALQKRNDALVKQYQDAMKKRQEAYAKQMEEFRKAGVTPQQFLQMQRDAILAQTPKSRQSALKRKWLREDRIRERAMEVDRRNGKTPDADGGLDLGGGLGDLGGDDVETPKAETTKAETTEAESTEKPAAEAKPEETTEAKPEAAEKAETDE